LLFWLFVCWCLHLYGVSLKVSANKKILPLIFLLSASFTKSNKVEEARVLKDFMAQHSLKEIDISDSSNTLI